MRINRRNLCTALTLGLAKTRQAHAAPRRLRHYIFLGQDREQLPAAAEYLRLPALEGVQIAYSWRQIETDAGKYDFAAIHEDLDWLTRRKKRLWVQLQDVTFNPTRINVPLYLQKDPRYQGGAARQYDIKAGDETNATVAGWVARRWDPAVQERLDLLFAAFGKEFDGRIEGINLAESSVDFGETGRLFPTGFTPESYRDAIIRNLRALKHAFPRSIAMQYANFMPGEWRPTGDRGYLRAVYEAAEKAGVGVGGPDLLPFRHGQLKGPYPLLREAAGKVPTGLAVQDGNYADPHPQTGEPAGIPALIALARDYLRLDYLFWCTEEPYFTRDLLPYLTHG